MSDNENDFQSNNSFEEKNGAEIEKEAFENNNASDIISESQNSNDDMFTDVSSGNTTQEDFHFTDSVSYPEDKDNDAVKADYQPVGYDEPTTPDQTDYSQQNNPYSQNYSSENPQQTNPYSSSYNSQNYSQNQGQPVNPYSQQNNNSNPHFNGQQVNQQYPFNGNNFNNQQPPKKKGNGKTVAAIIVVAAVVIAIIAIVCGIVASKNNKNNQNETPSATSAFVTEGTTGNDTNTTGDTASVKVTNNSSSALSAVEIAEKVRPSVVGVMTYSSGQLDGEGSGVIMGEDSSGKYTYIITCAHVISESGVTFGIMTLDGTTYEATRVAIDERTDIGVLKIEATGLKAAEFGDSTALKIGETVYAIGNPGGSAYFGSMTDGIISAIDRSVNSTYTMTCIQHNAAINPGNSGGALVNSAGQVIGINSSKIASTDYEGMGFAVPMSVAKSVVDNLIQYGYVPNRPKLGIQYAQLSSNQLYSMVAQIKGLPQGSLIIASISSDSAFAGTNAQVGDIITAVNGKDMDDSSTLLDLIDTGAVGDTITLTLCRIQSNTYKVSTFDVQIKLVEDRGTIEEQTTTAQSSNGGSGNFSDFFSQYFGDDFGF